MTESNLEALAAELDETREAMEHHDEQVNWHLGRYMWLKAHYDELARMLPGLVEAEETAAKAWKNG